MIGQRPGWFRVRLVTRPNGSTAWGRAGPFILVTSAHSDAISDWEGSDDAVTGIHGPLGEGGLIGTSGAALSHGCIRLQLADLAHLRPVPVGPPLPSPRCGNHFTMR